jgi:hypothetical protein
VLERQRETVTLCWWPAGQEENITLRIYYQHKYEIRKWNHVKSGVKRPHYAPCMRLGTEEYSSYLFLTSVQEGMIGQRHTPAALYSRGNNPGTYWTGGWVGPRACLDTEATEQMFCQMESYTGL